MSQDQIHTKPMNSKAPLYKIMTPKRISTLVVSCLCMASAGSLFSFSVLSEQLKSQLSFSSVDINTVSGVGNAALYVVCI